MILIPGNRPVQGRAKQWAAPGPQCKPFEGTIITTAIDQPEKFGLRTVSASPQHSATQRRLDIYA